MLEVGGWTAVKGGEEAGRRKSKMDNRKVAAHSLEAKEYDWDRMDR
jgi:hypothetical protein